MRLRSVLGGIGALLLLLAQPAQACSPVPGYIRPSNFELAQIAHAIVVATPVSERRPKGRNAFPGTGVVTFQVREALKGELSGEVEVTGLQLGRTFPSSSADIRFSHPEGHAGPCNRMTMARGGTYLLFLQRAGAHYATLGFPFSRVSEDYAGPDSLWSQTVRAYLEIQRTAPPMAQLERLEALRDTLLAARTRADAVRADDITDHLGSISPWKPTAFLLDAWDRETHGRPPRYPARQGDIDAERSDAAAMTSAIMRELVGDERPPPRARRSPAQLRILKSLLEREHPDAAPLFEPFAREGAPADELAMALRFMAANGRFHQAYDLIEARAEAVVTAASEDDAGALLWAIAEAMDENHYGDGQPRWRADPYAAERWPKLALRLTTAAEARGLSGPYGETLKTLVGSDYRADPQLTLAVSGDDNAITEWAARELTRPQVLGAPRAEGWSDPLTLPLRIHLRWQGLSGDEDEPPLIAVACAGPAERRLLFREWGQVGGSSSILAILRLSLLPGLTDEDRAILADAMVAWDARYKAERNESWITASEAAQKIARRETPTLKDLKPIKPPVCPARLTLPHPAASAM